ncbi:hypothetical protein CBS101457_006681 [Exobasidium rhododendri]|nr:hypothetical protein CBS101457_006681 [Exobasidium rhododendri]
MEVGRTQQYSGSGLAILRSHGSPSRPGSSFTHLSSTFPLKLISPRTSSRDASLRIARQSSAMAESKAVAALYIVGYGGGLVSGDVVSIDFDVGQHCTLLLLTQGSTKVFKMRGKHLGSAVISACTSQNLRCIVRPKATLINLPDPVTCFADSRYRQKQQFDLRCPHTSSLVLLDWFTPGRQHLASKNGTKVLNENWAFDFYESRNEIRRGDKVIAREVATLERNSINDIAEKCEPFTCFATLFLVGVDVVEIVKRLQDDFYKIQQGNKQQQQQFRQRATHPPQEPLIWSCSTLEKAREEHAKDQKSSTAIVVRVAGMSTEVVRAWLRDNLLPLKQLVGDDLYRQSLGL